MMIVRDNLVIGTKTGKCFYTGLDKADAERWLRNRKALRRRRENDDAMRSLGLTKVRGNLGGVYWE